MVFIEPSFPYFPMRGPRTIAPARAATPPTICTTEDPAKSTWPCPKWKLTPSWESHPPPQTQFPKRGYTNIEIKSPYMTKDLNDHLSAMAPVGMVAVVSMNTIWKRNNA